MEMTQYFPVVVEREDNGTFSAWVAGLPGVYAAADSMGAAKRGLREALGAHLRALEEFGQQPRSEAAEVAVLRYTPTRRPHLRFAGVGALLGRTTSTAKAAAARRNGRKGGRPRTAPARR
jgi:predicted RNase H-like HicB family nuclease